MFGVYCKLIIRCFVFVLHPRLLVRGHDKNSLGKGFCTDVRSSPRRTAAGRKTGRGGSAISCTVLSISVDQSFNHATDWVAMHVASVILVGFPALTAALPGTWDGGILCLDASKIKQPSDVWLSPAPRKILCAGGDFTLQKSRHTKHNS